MSSKWSRWAFGLIVITILFFGCTSGRNETTPASTSPTPTKGTQQLASQAAPLRTTGHTEAHGGGAIPDEREHCFKRDDTRDLILNYTSDDDLTNSTVSAFLINFNDVNAPIVVQDVPTITKDGKTATIKFSDAGIAAKSKTNNKSNLGHLGPGPYTEVTVVDPATGTGMASAVSKPRTGDVYQYRTVDDPKSDAALMLKHPQRR